MSFSDALNRGDLDAARLRLAEMASESDVEPVMLSDAHADLAAAFDRAGRHDEAIESMESAIERGYRAVPDPRSDIAEFHLRGGRADQAAAIWAELRAAELDDVWLYNAAGLSYQEIGDHELAVQWLAEGIEVAARTGDPERLLGQLRDVRGQSLSALGRAPDDVQDAKPVASPVDRLAEARDTLDPFIEQGETVQVSLAWFPGGEYERALLRWPSLAEDWADVPHDAYCSRFDGNLKWMRARGVPVRAVAPLLVEPFVAWCAERGKDPEQARAEYAAQVTRAGDAIDWPPGRNEPCWCGSERKYKKCCGPAPARPMPPHPAE